MLMHVTVQYETVSRTGYKTAKCPGCGKRLKRQRTFCQTLNPWNRASDGRVKSREDIVEELRAEIERWQQEPELCAKCEAAARDRQGGGD